MKRILTILIALLHLAVSSGIALEIHHCMNQVAGVSFVRSHEKSCGSCGMQKGGNNCCKDDLKIIKLTDKYKLVHASFRISIPEAVPLNQFFQSVAHPLSIALFPVPGTEYPPGPSSTLLRKLHGVFRI